MVFYRKIIYKDYKKQRNFPKLRKRKEDESNLNQVHVTIPNDFKKSFKPNIRVGIEALKRCIDFAERMTFGDGNHNKFSFGSDNYPREQKEIYRDALQGKIAELAFYNYLYIHKIRTKEEPNFESWDLGIWEDCDFELAHNNKKISIKSTKNFGQLLLIERERYNEEGLYIEPAEGNTPIKYDYIFLCRVSNIYNDSQIEDYRQNKNLGNIECEITGFITFNQFKDVIRRKQYLPKGIILGMPLKVANYYILASDLSTDIEQLKN
ncbi:MAG: hypothetical protein ACOCRK_10040 [bacterium]